MKLDVFRKICHCAQLETLGDCYRDQDLSIVLCHGCFDIVHPGHLRYLQFAQRQGDILVVSLTGDDAIEKSDGTRPYIPQELRAENLAAIEFVDHVVIADGPTALPVIQNLRPDVYIKGKEYEHSSHPGFCEEKQLIEQTGGKVIFSSGDVVFSSTALLENLGQTLSADGLGQVTRLQHNCQRWQVNIGSMQRLIRQGFAGKKVVVVGDSICDQYIFCDASNVAGEAPILSVKPLKEIDYPGGGAIIASHLMNLGAQVHLVTTVADDEPSEKLMNQMKRKGIETTAYQTHQNLPTKQRFLVETQKLLKVDRAEPRPLDSETERRMLGALAELRSDIDAVIFTDFGYGTITLPLLEQALPMLRPVVDIIAGDVSGLRRSLLHMKDADLLTPTEREMRSVMGDFESSLPGVAMQLMQKLNLGNLAVTMGQRGCMLFRPREEEPTHWFESRLRSEHLPSMGKVVVDQVGAGDAFLPTATLALCAGASLPQACYLASAAAAISLRKMGNQSIHADELVELIAHRPELQVANSLATGSALAEQSCRSGPALT